MLGFQPRSERKVGIGETKGLRLGRTVCVKALPEARPKGTEVQNSGKGSRGGWTSSIPVSNVFL